ncbi:protein TIFY 6B isoform X2 [Punica granatum]|uniref:Protein TIFY n=1 Tax=Punica granatum TaxID=22663 RepID=A0A6P8E8F6_PUNGR|nr:protein TIFY 6B isoform X2 [Punica granatum]
MERDFLGLLTVKEETADVTADSVYNSALSLSYSVPEQLVNSRIQARGRESGMQWSFSNKAPGPSQYMSFWASQEDGLRKNVQDQLDSNQRSSSSRAKKNVVIEKSAGTNYPISVYPMQHFSTHSIGRSNEMKMFPSSNQPNQAITVMMSPPVVHSRVSSIGQNMICSAISPQPLGGVPVLPPVSVLPTSGSVIGSTDLRNGNKQHHGPAQLTIFYAGSVSVFDDVSPEKAQAIMFLASNGPSVAHHKTVPAAEVLGPFKKPVTDENSNGNGSYSPAFLGLPGAVSVCSRAVSPSQGKPICNLELGTAKCMGSLETPVIACQEPPKSIHSLGSPSTPLFSTVALPQARKASLARFLEKRKERVTSTSPYPVSKKSPESSISKV